MDAWAVWVVVLGIITKARTGLSAEWQTSPDPVIYACKGRTVQFPWKLNVDPRSEFVENVHWFYQGTFSSDLFATDTHGQFLPALKYASRVTQLQDRGVALRDVTLNDAGNYSVEALVRQSNTSLVSHLYSHSVYLQVSDGLMVQGGRLEVTQDPVALWDMTSEQWTIRLWCGVFTFKGQPPVRVEWIIPSGDVRLSSGYTGGRFYLSLAAPVLPDGNYTCRVPQQFYPDMCSTDKRAARLLGADLRASIIVDEVRARLTLAEADLGRCHLDNGRLEVTVENLTDSLKGMKSELLQMQQSLKDEIQAVCNATKEKVPQEDVCLGTINYRTINDATGIRDLSGAEGSMCDKNITAGWYRWFLNGQDATIPTSCTPIRKCGTHATMWIDLKGQPLPAVGREVQGRACAHWDSNCCRWERPSVTVRNCGSYYVYLLDPDPNCSLAYCLQRKI